MFKIGWKAAELKRTKLQSEIQREKSELQRKRLEKRLKMSGKASGSPAKNLKKTKWEPNDDDDDDVLDDLVVETGQEKRQPSYSQLKPGGSVTKGIDRKTHLDQRQARIAAAAGKPDKGQEEMEQERLERETEELTSQLKKAEGVETQAREKELKDKAKRYSQRITSGQFLKQPKAVMLVEPKKRKKSMKRGSRGFSSSRRKPPLYQYEESGR